MRVKAILLSAVLSLNASAALADESPIQKSGIFNHLGYSLLGSYTTFKFDSLSGINFNHFLGHSNLYSASVGNIQLAPDWTFGGAYFKVDTFLRSNLFVDPGLPTMTRQSIRNNTLFVHLLKQVTKEFFVDLAGAYGQNKVSSNSILMPNTPDAIVGYAHSTNHSWFSSLTALYSKPWHNLVINGFGRLLYSELDAGAYNFHFEPILPAQNVRALTTKGLFLMESIELGYMLNPQVMPFANVGLLEVLSYTNSRPLISVPINGLLPQLSMNQSGYRLGGGLSFYHKQFNLRLEQQYYRSGGTYTSYQTILGLRYLVN